MSDSFTAPKTAIYHLTLTIDGKVTGEIEKELPLLENMPEVQRENLLRKEWANLLKGKGGDHEQKTN